MGRTRTSSSSSRIESSSGSQASSGIGSGRGGTGVRVSGASGEQASATASPARPCARRGGRRSAGAGRRGSISAPGTRSRSAAAASSRSARGTCTGCRPRRVATARRARGRAGRRSGAVKRRRRVEPVARADAGQDLLAPLAVLVLVDQRADFRASEQLAGLRAPTLPADEAGPATGVRAPPRAGRSRRAARLTVTPKCSRWATQMSSRPRNVERLGLTVDDERRASRARPVRPGVARPGRRPCEDAEAASERSSRSRLGACVRAPPAGGLPDPRPLPGLDLEHCSPSA